jgi:hypothetical protein
MKLTNALKKISTISACVLLFACSSSKIIISGQIVNQTGIPIPQAEVSTEPPTDLVTTNQDGYFFLTRQVGGPEGEAEIKPGVYQVKVSKDGFVTLSISVNAMKGNVWANRHILQPERALIDTVAPDVTEDPDSVNHGSAVMEGM